MIEEIEHNIWVKGALFLFQEKRKSGKHDHCTSYKRDDVWLELFTSNEGDPRWVAFLGKSPVWGRGYYVSSPERALSSLHDKVKRELQIQTEELKCVRMNHDRCLDSMMSINSVWKEVDDE